MADITQAFQECFDYHSFQIYWNSAYVECGYVWDGYVGGDPTGTVQGGTVFLRRR